MPRSFSRSTQPSRSGRVGEMAGGQLGLDAAEGAASRHKHRAFGEFPLPGLPDDVEHRLSGVAGTVPADLGVLRDGHRVSPPHALDGPADQVCGQEHVFPGVAASEG